MKPVWYVVIGLSVALLLCIFFYSQKVHTLQKEITNEKVHRALSLDSVKSAYIIRLEDSVRVLDAKYARKIDSLEIKKSNLKIKYEKINSDYSSIVINRPAY